MVTVFILKNLIGDYFGRGVLGVLDASDRKNDDGSAQRGMTVFLAESGKRSSQDGMTYGSLIDYESQKIKTDSALHHRGRVIFFHEVLWFMSVSPWIMDGHIR